MRRHKTPVHKNSGLFIWQAARIRMYSVSRIEVKKFTTFQRVTLGNGARYARVGVRYSVSDKDPPNDQSRVIVQGDAFDPASWDRIDAEMKSREVIAFDIVIARPFGALKKYTTEAHLSSKGYGFFLQDAINQLYSRVSSDGGLLLFEADLYTYHYFGMERWVSVLKQKFGADFVCSIAEDSETDVGFFRAAITKRQHSPKNL